MAVILVALRVVVKEKKMSLEVELLLKMGVAYLLNNHNARFAKTFLVESNVCFPVDTVCVVNVNWY
jgi:hypothetical protein